MRISKILHKTIIYAIFLSVSAVAQQEAQKRYSFDIPALPLNEALLRLSAQSNMQISIPATELPDIAAEAVNNRLTVVAALNKLLHNTDLTFAIVSSETIVIGRDLSRYAQTGVKVYNPNAPAITRPAPETTISRPQFEDEQERYLEDVQITALRRPQSLKDVPVHVRVMPNIVLQDIHLTRLEELAFALPTVTFTQRRGYDQSTFRIRGMGTQVLGAGVEPSVATMIDGVVMARGGAMLNELQDIERIEILNGPQSTLFGKNASAGLLNVITQKPDHQEFSGYIGGRATADEEYGWRAGITGPVNSQLAYRLSAYGSFWDGNVDNITTGNTVNGTVSNGVRGKLSLLTDQGHDFMLAADFSYQNTECCARITRVDALGLIIQPSFIGSSDPAGSIADIIGIPITSVSDQIAQNRDPRQDSRNYGVSLEANFSLGEHTLTSISAYRVWNSRNAWDNDLLPVEFHRMQRSFRDADWFTQELRLTSPEIERFDYIAGLYYFNSETDALEEADRHLLDIDIDQFIFVRSNIGQENSAAFGHINYHPTEKLTVFGGGRILLDKVAASAMRGGQDLAPNGSLAFDHTTPTVANSKTDVAFIGRLGLQYAVNGATNFYAAYGKGYKSRGFGVEFGFDPVSFLEDEPVAPERTRSFEVGVKGNYFDRRLQAELIAYHTNIEDLQLGLRDLTSIANTLGTVPKTTVKGMELSLLAAPTNQLSFSAGIAYNEAKFRSFPNANCYLGQSEAGGCIDGAQDLSGHVLENAPRWRGVMNVRYDDQIWQRWSGFLQAGLRFQSRVFLSDDADPRSVQRAYGVVDLSAGAYLPNDAVKISLFVKNLTGTKYVAGVSANSADGGGVLVHTLPRDFHTYWGLSLSFSL